MCNKSKYRKPVEGNKEERTSKASDWLDTLNKKWSSQVENAVKNTTAYRGIFPENFSLPERPDRSTKTQIFTNDVVTCTKASVSRGNKVMVLNFASFTSPGGGFLKGSTAQEEAICYSSGLYPCLSSKQDWYNENREKSTDFIYTNDYIYSKDVPFIVNNKCFLADVLTMAAPNNKKSKLSPVEDIFEERMRCAYLIGIQNNIDVAILGAWGCGVFGNDPAFVAYTWKTLTKEYDGYFKEVIHPVLDAKMCKIFKDVYK